jgi:hypothetical protein
MTDGAQDVLIEVPHLGATCAGFLRAMLDDTETFCKPNRIHSEQCVDGTLNSQQMPKTKRAHSQAKCGLSVNCGLGM